MHPDSRIPPKVYRCSVSVEMRVLDVGFRGVGLRVQDAGFGITLTKMTRLRLILKIARLRNDKPDDKTTLVLGLQGGIAIRTRREPKRAFRCRRSGGEKGDGDKADGEKADGDKAERDKAGPLGWPYLL